MQILHLHALYGCSIKIHATEVFCALNLSPTRVSHVDSLFTYEEQKQASLFIYLDWVMTYCTLLPHMTALFMTSRTNAARHNMAAFTAVFPWLSNVEFCRNQRVIQLKNWCESLSLHFYRQGTWCIFARDPFQWVSASFKKKKKKIVI